MIRSRLAYTLLGWLLMPRALWHLLRRSFRQPEYRRHVAERFGRFDVTVAQPAIWVHAVSVGETRAAEPLIAALERAYPQHRILLTHMTPTGRATGEALYGERVARCYLPYDLPFAVRRFLDRFRPAVAILMETEIWPNFVHECASRNVPAYLVNARLSEKSLGGYRRFSRLARATLGELTAIVAQTAADAERFRALGAGRVHVSGNLKFDIAPPPQLLELGAHFQAQYGAGRRVLLAASTRDGEEALLLDALAGLAVPGLLTVIVPRHPQRFEDVAALLDKRGLVWQRRSRNEPIAGGTRVVLGDSMGEMFAYYAACDIAMIGGSLLPFGAQNLIEACAVGKPVLIGPSTYNFEEATQLALAAGAAIRVVNAADVVRTAQALFGDAQRMQRMAVAAREFAAAHRGATEKTLALVKF